MRAISAVLPLLGMALAVPAGSASETCNQASTGMKRWTVKDFDFHASYIFSTPAHQNSWGYANFSLENPIIPEMALCSVASNQLQDFFYSTLDYQCKLDSHESSTSFRYSRPSGELEIKQSWYCPNKTSHFTARGSIRLDLHCQEKNWQNPNWKMGQIYSQRQITCDPVSVVVPVTQMSGVAAAAAVA